ncbi:hypothetical protein ACIRJR_10430 [Streptomyces sp. NPDC102402]|uniref:hypothetical protein n=1 Tax=Streptomyces sp. NPDC102402 TaxID=3366169 RepID=UPI0037FDD8F2
MFDEAGGVDGVAGPLRSSGPARRPGRSAGRRTAVALLVLPLLGALGLVMGPAGSAPAQAASACSGRLVKTVTFAAGSLRVYKSRAYACAVTVAKKPGPRRTMRVSLQPRGGHAVVDSGKFTTLAGPVTVHALNRCVRASGAVGGSSGSTGWILC